MVKYQLCIVQWRKSDDCLLHSVTGNAPLGKPNSQWTVTYSLTHFWPKFTKKETPPKNKKNNKKKKEMGQG